jgi:hypothetical protein
MKRVGLLIALLLLSGLATAEPPIVGGGGGPNFTVVPSVFDPHGTHLVAA